MRTLGEQWVEEDGHMYKDISKYEKKDLGSVNENGCLPSSWGEYPEIIDFGDGSYVEVHCLLRRESKTLKAEYAYGDTRQEAVDNWNRRA